MAALTGNERVNYLFGQSTGSPMQNSGQSFEVRSSHIASAGGTTSTSQLNVTASVALVSVPGLQNTIIAPGTYRFSAYLPGTANSSGGIQYAFSYSNMTLTSIAATGKAFTSAAVAVQYTSTTASTTALISSTSAAIYSEIVGTMVVGAVSVNTGGTIALQFAQSASTAATSSVYAGAFMQIAFVG